MTSFERYISFLERIHFAVFGAPLGDTMKLFIRELHWSMFGGILSSIILFSVSVFAGRILGTEQYGAYTFAIALAQCISLAMTLGFELAIVRGLSITNKDSMSQKYIISSAELFLLVTIIVVNTIVYFLPLKFEKGIVMSLASVIAIRLLLDGMIRGLGLFAYQAIAKILEASAVAILFAVALKFGYFSTDMSYLAVMLGATLLVLPWYFAKLKTYGSFGKVSYPAIHMLWSYGSVAILGSIITTVLGFATKFIIRHQMGYVFLGQFAAYHMASIAAMAFLGGLVINVFFPLAVRERGSAEMISRMHRTTILLALPLWIISALATNIAIVLYGHSYYLTWWFGTAMAAAAVIQFFCSMYWWCIASAGVHGVKYAALHAGIAGVIFILSLTVLLQFHPLFGIIASYLLSDMYVIFAISRWRPVLEPSQTDVPIVI